MTFGPDGALAGLGRRGRDPEWVFRSTASEGDVEVVSAATEVRVVRHQRRWRVTERWSVRARNEVVQRRISIRNAGEGSAELRGFSVALAPVKATGHTVAVFPGALPVGDRELGAAGDVVRTLQNGLPYRDPLAFLWDERRGSGLGCWWYSESDYVSVHIEGGGRSPRVVHTVDMLALLDPGEELELGTQFVWLAQGRRARVVRSVSRAHRAAGVRIPSNRAPGLESAVIYCGHPGGAPEQCFRGGTFADIVERLPALRDMGVDLIWLLPIFEHGDGIRWNLYSPFDHRRISHLYGGEHGLRQLAGAVAAAGMRLILDVVPHGPPDHTELAHEHPGWVTLDEHGNPAYAWRQLAFDNANPGWQRWMAQAIGRWAGTLHLAGVRVDVAQGGPPNWDPRVPYHASFSGLGGGLGMTRALRDAVVQATGSAAVIPEEWTGAVPFMTCGDLVYDFQLFFLMLELQAAGSSPEAWASSLQAFLADQQAATPAGALRMRFTCNHDTVLHLGLSRPRDVWGDDRAQTLLALLLLIDGVPMIFAGEEDRRLFTSLPADAAMVDWATQLARSPIAYAPAGWPRREESPDDVRRRASAPGPIAAPLISRLTALRRRLPALAGGAADYLSVHADGGVFACVRGAGDTQVIVLVSFNPEHAAVDVQLPSALRRLVWRDAASGAPWETTQTGVRGPVAGHGHVVLEATGQERFCERRSLQRS